MRAVVHDRYGPPEVLRVDDVERPVPKEDEVLVKVHASTVTRGDAMGVRGADYRFTRVFTGIRRPRRANLGTEFAGRVEEVGTAVMLAHHVETEVTGVCDTQTSSSCDRSARGRCWIVCARTSRKTARRTT